MRTAKDEAQSCSTAPAPCELFVRPRRRGTGWLRGGNVLERWLPAAHGSYMAVTSRSGSCSSAPLTCRAGRCQTPLRSCAAGRYVAAGNRLVCAGWVCASRMGRRGRGDATMKQWDRGCLAIRRRPAMRRRCSGNVGDGSGPFRL